MPFFRYKAKDQQNRFFKGLVEAISDGQAAEILEEKDLAVIYLEPVGKNKYHFLPDWLFSRLSSKDLVILSRQLAILVTSDLSLVEALDTLVHQSEDPVVKVVMSEIADSVRGGKRLSESLAEHPHIFSSFYVKLVETGEQVGRLDEVLEYLADEQEKNYDLKSKIKGMMIYPAFIFLMLVAVVIFMMIFVIPRIMVILEEANVALPLSTRILIGASNFLINWGLLTLLVLVGLSGLFYFYINSKRGRANWDLFKLKVPVFGKIVQNITIVRMCNSLSLLLKGGVDMVTALKTVSDSLTNTVYRQLMNQATKAVEDGNYLAETLLVSSIIPYMVTAMIQVGEKTGHLDKSLDKVTDFYTREVQNSVNSLVSLIEPLVIIIMGIAVGIVVSAMILPMYQVVSAI